MPKYRNHAQLVQGVSQIREPSLTQGERLFLDVLAAHAVKSSPHPGNERLMVGCGVTTARAVQKIAEKLISKGLIEVLQRGDGRGHATVYRICTEDARFPHPKQRTPEFAVSSDKPRTPEFVVLEEKLRAVEHETANSQTENSELQKDKPRTPEFATDLEERIQRTNTNTNAADAAGVCNGEKIAVPQWLPIPQWMNYLKFRTSKKLSVDVMAQEVLIKRLAELRDQGNDPRRIVEEAMVRGWKSFYPVEPESRSERNMRIAKLSGKERDERNMRLAGLGRCQGETEGGDSS